MVTPMEEHNLRTVGEVADLVGVSVRTLHHWDDIGLVSPQWRSWADYRLYSEEDVAQFYQVLLYRETGMPLKTIRDMLESNSSPADHLQRQLELLQQRKHRVTSMIESVHQLLEDTMNHNEPLSADHTAKILGREWSKWEKEAEERWGDTEDWAISQQRAAQLGKDDFAARQMVMHKLDQRLAQAFESGMAPDSPDAHALAEEHRACLSQWFPVSHSKHALIAQGYTADPRFTAHYDKYAKGLAVWLEKAIQSNAQRHTQ